MQEYPGEAKMAVKLPVSEEVIKLAASMADRARQIADRCLGKLAPIMTSPVPTNLVGTGKTEREYPPLFSELRERLSYIGTALNDIEDALSRTEI